jgi:hypothetical protein
MKQAIHIFKKDVRYLRGEIALVLALILLLAWTETHLALADGLVEVLAGLAMNYLIARVVHAEAIPGHNQFWITRPYRWKSLLGAKILFVLAFVNLPLFAAQGYAIVAQRFQFGVNLPGLLWSQVLTIVCMSLPVMCLASLTSGLIPFFVTEFILVAEVFIGEVLIHAPLSWNAFLPGAKPGPEAADWIRDFLVMSVIAGFAAFVLCRQYRTRRTDTGRTWAVRGAAIAAAIYLLLPWPLLLGIQSVFSSESFDTSKLQVTSGSVLKSVFPMRGGRNAPSPPPEVSLPLLLRGIPVSREVAIDALDVNLEAPDGQTWNSGIIAPIMVDDAEPMVDANLHVDPAFLQSEGSGAVTVRAKIYLTLFGDPQSEVIPVLPEPVDAIDGLQCSVALFNEIYCRSLFRWPRRRVYAKGVENGLESRVRAISYSPFPATLGFNPVEQHSLGGGPSLKHIAITTKAPLSHFHTDEVLQGIVLNDYTQDAKRRAMMAPKPPRSAPGQ